MEYEIWSEGFSATGQSGAAKFLGKQEGDSFADACSRLADADPDFSAYYDPAKLTFWGCRLFDNEKEARRAFG